MTTLAVGAELALGGAAAMGIPIAIHLLTRWRRQRHVWGAMRFLLEAFRRHRYRLRLEQLLLLLVRCLIPLLLGLALWDPTLAGFGSTLGLGATDRLVCLVLDDSLSSQARPGDGPETRFDELRAKALWIVAHLGRSDRVAVWRSGRPGGAVLSPGTYDHRQAAQVLRALEPRFSRGDLAQTLKLVEAHLAEQPPAAPADRVHVVVLSDFSRGAWVSEQQPSPGSVTRIAWNHERGRLILTRPMPAVSNRAIEALRPRRHLVLLESNTASTLPVDVTLWRPLGEDAGGASALTTLELEVHGPAEGVLGALRREHRWESGQDRATLRLDIPVTVPAALGDARLVIRGRIDADALTADDSRLAVVEVRQRLRVALVDARDAEPSHDGLSARRWLELALSPTRHPGAENQIETVVVPAQALTDQSVSGFDAALVLRPDMLDAAGWAALGGLATRGGLVWIVPPRMTTSVTWGLALREALGLSWELGVEPVKPAGVDAAGEQSYWTLTSDKPAPEPVALLSADWAVLLSGVRVYQRLPLTVRNPTEEMWLSVADPRAGDGTALLACGQVGQGRVLFLSAAIDLGWSNLPAKPLFVPLLHESLRGLLGESGPAARVAGIVCGDQPLLGREWDDAQELVRRPIQGGSGGAVLLRRAEAGLTPIDPLEHPGVYDSSPRRVQTLAVNPDPAGGNTAALSEAEVAEWFAGVSGWSWLDPADARGTPVFLAALAASVNIGGVLLWVVLGLVALEAALARWFSHAKVGPRVTWMSRLKRLVREGGT